MHSQAIFLINNLNDIHWEKYKSFQFKPIKWDYRPKAFYQDIHNCTNEATESMSSKYIIRLILNIKVITVNT